MNNFHDQDLLKLAKQKSIDKVAENAAQDSTQNHSRWLAALGAWMVKKGEKLQARSAVSLRTSQLEFSHGKAKKTSG